MRRKNNNISAVSLEALHTHTHTSNLKNKKIGGEQ